MKGILRPFAAAPRYEQHAELLYQIEDYNREIALQLAQFADVSNDAIIEVEALIT